MSSLFFARLRPIYHTVIVNSVRFCLLQKTNDTVFVSLTLVASDDDDNNADADKSVQLILLLQNSVRWIVNPSEFLVVKLEQKLLSLNQMVIVTERRTIVSHIQFCTQSKAARE